MENKYFTYTDIRIEAIKAGISDNKVSIGIWARQNGYYQMRKSKDKKTTIYYYKLNG